MQHTAIVVSHTHWDREWYLPFQEFRMRLVDTIDDLLELLARDSEFKHFMLDGQSIVLEDYLEVRPERRGELQGFIRDGRISVGPWYVLPDEALVSGEALIRNLMVGQWVAEPFGQVMQIGYVPDTFGHINQLPQILRGWGLRAAVIMRGVPDSPCEFLWEGADGEPLLAINLRRSYGNATNLVSDDSLVRRLRELTDDLAAHSSTPYMLLTNGSDHRPAEETVPAALSRLNEELPHVRFVHSSLESFVDAVLACEPKLVRRRQEMRHPGSQYLLPGVLSTRMWIKQQNADCQRLLERWAEPFSAWATLIGGRDRRPILRQAWRLLLQNHPHDSICGCSVDAVHRDNLVRFAGVRQIGERLLSESLGAIVRHALPRAGTDAFRLAVFNSEDGPRTDVAEATIELPVDSNNIALRDEESGVLLSAELLTREEPTPFSFAGGTSIANWLLGNIGTGTLLDEVILRVSLRREGADVWLDFLTGKTGGPDSTGVRACLDEIRSLTEADQTLTYHCHVDYVPKVKIRFVAPGVPAMGYKVFSLVQGMPPGGSAPIESASAARDSATIGNEFFRVEADEATGALRLRELATGRSWEGLNRFVDGGDAGDEYDYSPPLREDLVVSAPSTPPEIAVLRSSTAESLRIRMSYYLPRALASDRGTRSLDQVEMPIETIVTLYPGVRRIDIRTELANCAEDHRLRVHFPTGIAAGQILADAAFDVITRPRSATATGPDGKEVRVSTWPQQRWVGVESTHEGLLVASDGLPEYEVLDQDGLDTISITLLRCVGWLSRGDLLTRPGNAGPTAATPEAQCLGGQSFRYSIVPYQGSWEDAFGEAHRFVCPLRCLLGWGGAPVRPQQSLVEAHPTGVIVSAVKQGVRDRSLVVRVYNPLPRPVDLEVAVGLPFAKAVLTDLREEAESGPDPDGTALLDPHLFGFKLQSKRIQTVTFEGLELTKSSRRELHR